MWRVVKISTKIFIKNESKELEFLSYLVYSNKVPLIIGMRELLEKFIIYIDTENRSYIQEKDIQSTKYEVI